MTKQTEALKMAIEALEKYVGVVQHKFNAETWGDIEDGGKPAREAIQACKEALEQPAQEPVAWMRGALDNARDVCKYLDHNMVEKAKAHTEFFWNDLDKIREFDDTHPAPSWQGLSVQDVNNLMAMLDIDAGIVKTIEQALKEKNHG